MAGGLNIATLGLRLDGRKVISESRQVTTSLRGMGKAGMSAKAAMASLGVTLGGGLLIRKVLRDAGDFTSAMQQSLAIMADVSDMMENRMSDAARKVGIELNLGATAAAEAFFFLASAGLNAEQSIAALPAVAEFAKAGMFSMAIATDLATDAQSALGLASKDTEENLRGIVRVTDVLVKANTIANASVQQFATALTTEAGAALRTFNKDIEEGVAVLAVFADQGVKGQVAGSGLSRILRLMSAAAVNNADAYKRLNIEVFDGAGKMKNMADIIEDLENALGDMSDKTRTAALQQLGFQARVQGVILPLIGASEKIRQYEAALRAAGGTTADVAANQMQAPMERAGAALRVFGDIGIDVGTSILSVFVPALEFAAKHSTALKIAALALATALGTMAVAAGVAAFASSGAAVAFGVWASAVFVLAGAFGVLDTAMIIMQGTLIPLVVTAATAAAPFIALGLAVGGAVTALVFMFRAMENAIPDELTTSYERNSAALQDMTRDQLLAAEAAIEMQLARAKAARISVAAAGGRTTLAQQKIELEQMKQLADVRRLLAKGVRELTTAQEELEKVTRAVGEAAAEELRSLAALMVIVESIAAAEEERRRARSVEEAKERLLLLGAEQESLDELAKIVRGITKDEKDRLDQIAEGIEAARRFERAWVDALSNISRELGRMASLIVNAVSLFVQMQKEGIKAKALDLAGGLGAGAAGFGVGMGTGSPVAGLFGGAASGFIASGGNPFGALIGGVTGLVGGLITMGDEAAAAARRLRKAQQEFSSSLEDMIQSLLAAAGSLAQQAAEAFRQEINKLLAEFGGKFPGTLSFAGREPFQLPADLSADALDAFIERMQRFMDLLRPGTDAFEAFADILEIAILRAEALREAEEARVAALEAEFDLDLRMREARNEGERAMIALIAAQEAERKAAQDLVDQGIITEEQYRRLGSVLATELVDAINAVHRAAFDFTQDLMIRGAMAAGLDVTRAGMVIGHRRELRDTDLSASDRVLLEAAQAMELFAFDQGRELERQTRIIMEAADAEIAALQSLKDIAVEELRTAQDALRAQEQAVMATRRVVDTLTGFLGALAVDASLSPASLLAATRGQFEETLTMAGGGDREAAMGLPGVARAFLDASRAFNASGPAFQADLARVQAEIMAMRDQFGAQLSVEESMLAELKAQTVALADQIEILTSAQADALANAQAQIAALQEEFRQANAEAGARFKAWLKAQVMPQITILDRPSWWVDSTTPMVLAQDETTAAVMTGTEINRLGNREIVDRLERIEEAVDRGTREVKRTNQEAL